MKYPILLVLVLAAGCQVPLPLDLPWNVDAADGDAFDSGDGLAGGGDVNPLDAGDALADHGAANAPSCGDGTCNGAETASGCAADCGFLLNRLGSACTNPATKDSCSQGFFCVARGAAGGGSVCVADFSTWASMPNAHPAGDFTEYPDYVTDKLSMLSWAKATLAPADWDEALTICNSATYGGYNDWRIPTRAELVSLSDRTIKQPASSAPNMSWPAQPILLTGIPWPAVVGGVSEVGVVWYISFFDGSITSNGKSGGPVRCVRGGDAGGSGAGARFALDDGGLTVLDRISGLHWQQGWSTASMTWAAAGIWCSANTPALPGGGWRLPTSHELEDLLDSQRSSPPVDPVFADTPSHPFWTSTASVASGAAWDVDFEYGYGSTDATTSAHRVRCVR